MEKGYYVVHLHRIEDSYCFGVFDSIGELEKALRKLFERNKDNVWRDEYFSGVRDLKLGNILDIDVVSTEYGWSIYVVILYTTINTAYQDISSELQDM